MERIDLTATKPSYCIIWPYLLRKWDLNVSQLCFLDIVRRWSRNAAEICELRRDEFTEMLNITKPTVTNYKNILTQKGLIYRDGKIVLSLSECAFEGFLDVTDSENQYTKMYLNLLKPLELTHIQSCLLYSIYQLSAPGKGSRFSAGYMAKFLNCSQSNIQKSLNELNKRGHLARVKGQGILRHTLSDQLTEFFYDSENKIRTRPSRRF